MSKPFMMLYIGDYLADTTHFSTEQHGAYLLLLFALWRREGYLPKDDRVLAKVAGLTLKKWRATASPIMALLTVEDGQITQRRLLCELQKVNVKSQKASQAGKASAAAKALKSQEAVPRIVAPELEQGASSQGGNHNQNHNQNKKEKKPPAVAGALAAPVIVPGWISPQAWQGYCEMRRGKRAPMTDRAKALVIKELEQLMRQGHDPNAVLDQSTQNAWTDVYELKSKDSKHGKPTANRNFLSAAASFIDEQFTLAAEPGNQGPDSPASGGAVVPLLPA
jgi:uncharacterized protein YdaU (DUF1376 family)